MTDPFSIPEVTIRNPEVSIKNFADMAKYGLVKNTTFKTYVIDPAGANPGVKQIQISTNEPTRKRMLIIVVDQPVALTLEQPNASPDANAVGSTLEGAYLPVINKPYEFYGPDAMWLNSLTGATPGRVTVIKEYC